MTTSDPKLVARPIMQAGTTVGLRYRVDAPLGSGGMSSVFTGHDTVLDRPVAIKLLHRRVGDDRRATERLLREAKAMARVTHAACVQVFDGGIDAQWGAYLIMERLVGEDLRRFLDARGPLPVPLALALFEQLSAVTQAVHDAGIVHRDLKPGNIFVVRPVPDVIPRIKLLDFGIAKLDGDANALTEPGDLLGTLAYLAPERWSSAAAPDVRMDVYALGAVLYEMLSGDPPFRADTKAALRLAAVNDPPPPLAVRRPDVPKRVIDAVERALSKQPADRPASVSALLESLGRTHRPESMPSEVGAQPFVGTARFRVQRCLSRGAHTEVYAAFDGEQDRPVALKRLHDARGSAVIDLKGEFRNRTGVHHPNLVRLDALWEEAGDLLMTMELVDGSGLLEYISGSDQRLRACLVQLADALEALHARGIVHRDVKLENILVEPSGRLVLLDFGLAKMWQDGGTPPRGTPAYVAPEVLEGQLGPEADLYAMGVLLHLALTGELPTDEQGELGLDAVSSSVADARSDLRVLCQRLLCADPARRPRARDVRAALDGRMDEVLDWLPPDAATRDAFVGRQEALALVDEALRAVADGAPRVVWIEGESGIGKSALLEVLRRDLRARPKTLVLVGRGRHGDALPFPALDEAIDGLATYLLSLPTSVTEVLVPKKAARSARLFPALASVPAIAREIATSETAESAAMTRQAAFDGLRELLARLAESRVVVMLLDDLQWIDADSRALLAHLLDGPQAMSLLVVGAVRTSVDSDELRKLDAALGPRIRRSTLGPLSHEESCALVRARWAGQTTLDLVRAARLADEGRGVPFLLEMLVVGGRTDANEGGGLDAILARRIGALPAGARRGLELVCVGWRPVPIHILRAAAALSGSNELEILLAERLLRAARGERDNRLEPYHDRIRDAVLATLSDDMRRDRHASLAAALERGSGSLPELLVEHLAGSGHVARAAEVALAAARTANDQLAFDRAAALFAIALEHGNFEHDAHLALLRDRARALQLARRQRECGDVFLLASGIAREADVAAELRNEAGVCLLLSGDVQRALQVLEPSLSRAGLRVPTSLDETISTTTATLGALASGGLVSRPPADPPSPEAERRVDLCLLLAQGLAHIDLRVLPFACAGLLGALELGDARRLQRAAALFVINAVEYMPNPLIAPALALCQKLTDDDPTPYARALLDSAVAENAHFASDFLEAEAAFERAERTLLDGCPDATRELATVRDLAVFVQYAQKGDFRTQLGRTQRWLAEADAARDVYHASMLRVAHAIVWIAQDNPARARAELRRAQDEWLGEAGVLEVGAALYHDIIDRYEEAELGGETEGAPRSALLRSPAASTPFLGGYLGLQEAWQALRAIAAGQDQGSARPDRVVEIVSSMRACGLPIWAAVADALEANLAFLQGEHELAVRGLDVAETRFKRMGMSCLAACARYRRGELVDGEVGARLLADAEADLHALGVHNVPRWTRAYWSMFDAQAARLRTADSGSSEPMLFRASEPSAV